MAYKIGQILTAPRNAESKKVISGEKVVISKGDKAIIGADHFAHLFRGGLIVALAEPDTVEGYDTEGLAEYLLKVLESRFPIREMREDYDIDRDDILAEIECALDEIGF